MFCGKGMRRPTIYIAIIILTALAVSGRFLDVRGIRTLITQSKLAFVGRVRAVKPSGITTSLSYPTWEGVVFEWLQVDVEVLEPIKGTKKGDVVQTAMLSVDETKESPPMVNAPGMLEPIKGDKFLLFLAPTTRTNLFAALTAPYDDDQSIFRLDRSLGEYASYQEGKERPDSPFYDRHSLIWSLVDEGGQLIPAGAEQLRSRFATEIAATPSNRVVYLQWQTQTNAAGWMWDVPKAVSETNR
jgi:hypothetical protein